MGDVATMETIPQTARGKLRRQATGEDELKKDLEKLKECVTKMTDPKGSEILENDETIEKQGECSGSS